MRRYIMMGNEYGQKKEVIKYILILLKNYIQHLGLMHS